MVNNKDNLEIWLLELQNHIQQPIIVNLFVSNKKIMFVGCKTRFFDEDTEECYDFDDDLKLKTKLKEFKNYFG